MPIFINLLSSYVVHFARGILLPLIEPSSLLFRFLTADGSFIAGYGNKCSQIANTSYIKYVTVSWWLGLSPSRDERSPRKLPELWNEVVPSLNILSAHHGVWGGMEQERRLRPRNSSTFLSIDVKIPSSRQFASHELLSPFL